MFESQIPEQFSMSYKKVTVLCHAYKEFLNIPFQQTVYLFSFY